MSRYGSVTSGAPTTRIVQSATAAGLQKLVNDLLTTLPLTQTITALTLAGAGDGHTFMATIEWAPTGAVQGGLAVSARVRCFLAGDATELQRYRDSIAAPSGLPVADSQIVGASSGGRFMGMVVYGVVTSSGGGILAALMANENQTIPPGTETQVIGFSTEFDTGGFADPANNRFVLPAGNYVLSAQVSLAGDTDPPTGTTRQVGLKQGATFFAFCRYAPAGSTSGIVCHSSRRLADPTTLLTCNVLHDASGGRQTTVLFHVLQLNAG